MKLPWGQPDDTGVTTYHPKFVRGMSIFFWVVCLWWAGELIFTGTVGDIVSQLPVIAFVALTMYLLFWLPGIRIEADSVTLDNVTRQIRVPFADLERVSTKFAFTVHEKSGRKYAAWAAPAGSAARTMYTIARSDRSQIGATTRAKLGRDEAHASELAGSDSGNAAMWVGQRWTTWQESRRDSGQTLATGERTTVTWRWWLIIPWAVLAAYSTIAVVRWLS